MRKKAKRQQKRIVIIAGPNGAGKTTFAREFLPREADCPDFINADLIAQGLAPFNPEKAAMQAGRVMLEQIAQKTDAGASFAFETTLAGMSYARHILRWRATGYHVKLVFLKLPTADAAVARVKMRVAQGGHNVPEAVVRRRFAAGLKNLETIYHKIVNTWVIYDNAGETPGFIAMGHR